MSDMFFSLDCVFVSLFGVLHWIVGFDCALYFGCLMSGCLNGNPFLFSFHDTMIIIIIIYKTNNSNSPLSSKGLASTGWIGRR